MSDAPANAGPIAALRNVSKRYGEQPVLEDVTVAFPRGETTAIVGASGSGKTTVLTLLNALERPQAGVVEVFGEPVPTTGLAQFRRQLGYSVQGAGLFPHLSVRGNVVLGAELDGMAPEVIAERYEALMAAMELDLALSDRYPHALSGGQQQRVGLCRALMLRPPLLLLDEPFSAIDPITRVEVYRVFAQAREDLAISTVLVTHDMREAVQLAQRLVILRDGRVLQEGPVAQVLEAPATDYVAQLVKAQL
ncbi:MAG: ATP-binding cassette domain-containing protein [Pseudomonadota bacterium]